MFEKNKHFYNNKWENYAVNSIRKQNTLYVIIAFEIHDHHHMPINYVRVQILEDAIRKNIVSDKNSLHRAITPVLTLGHCLALLPVQGIKGQNTSYLTWAITCTNFFQSIFHYKNIYLFFRNSHNYCRSTHLFSKSGVFDILFCYIISFNWFSLPVVYVLFVLSVSLLILSFSLLKIYQIGLTYYSTGTKGLRYLMKIIINNFVVIVTASPAAIRVFCNIYYFLNLFKRLVSFQAN